MTVGERGFRALGFGEPGGRRVPARKRAPPVAEHDRLCAAYCDTLSVIVKGVLELVIAVPPVGAPVVALMVTV
jgi:hypothetical protein